MPNDQKPTTTPEQVIEIWKTVIEVQRHFNDISMLIRNLFVTIMLGLFAAIGFMLDSKQTIGIGNVTVHFATVLPLFGIFVAYLFYFIDRYWYHRLLIGSVQHAIKIEGMHRDTIPELTLSDAIGVASPYKPAGVTRCAARLLVCHDKFRKTGMLHSDGKIEFFYKSVMAVLVLTTILLALFGGVSTSKQERAAAAAPATGGDQAAKSSDEQAPATVGQATPTGDGDKSTTDGEQTPASPSQAPTSSPSADQSTGHGEQSPTTNQAPATNSGTGSAGGGN